MIVDLITLILCFYLLAKVVDEYFIKSLDNIGDTLKLGPSVAGATLLAVGTSAPELSTNMFALFLVGVKPETGLGTIVGSAIFQILVVIGFASIVKTSYLNWKPVIRDGSFYSLTIILLIFIVRDNKITLAETTLLIITYLIYLLVLGLWTKYVRDESQKDSIDIAEEGIEDIQRKERKFFKKHFKFPINIINIPFSLIPDPSKKSKWTLPIFFSCLALIAGLCYLMVGSAESLAVSWGVSPAIIGLTILAGGTSVPELISSAIVSKEGRGDMAISNAIGSNIFDILMSLGLPLFIFTLKNGELDGVGAENISSSILLLFATLIAVLALLASQKFKAGKKFGWVLIGSYVLYVIAAYAGLL